DRDGVELADEVVERGHARAEDDVLVVVLPADDDVVRPHAVGDVVPAEGGGVGQPLGRAAGGRHQVDLGVAVVLAGDRRPRAVGGEGGGHVVAVVAGEAAGDATGGRHRVQVAGVGEGDAVAVDGREAQQPGLAGRGCGYGAEREKGGEQGRSSEHE